MQSCRQHNPKLLVCLALRVWSVRLGLFRTDYDSMNIK